MSSAKLSELVAPEGFDVLRGAVADVAERSFFMAADPCGDERLRELAAAYEAWLVASVRFDEPGCSGVASYVLPHDLGRALFDAFNGRDPLDPPPSFEELFDLVGEFANMICGAWLTRTANGPAFALGTPLVRATERGAALDAPAAMRVVMSVNDLPLVVVIAQA